MSLLKKSYIREELFTGQSHHKIGVDKKKAVLEVKDVPGKDRYDKVIKFWRKKYKK